VTAIETLLNRLPDIELRIDLKDLSWVPAPWSRSLITLPVKFTSRAQKPQPPLASGPGPGTAGARPTAPVPQAPAKNTRWSKFLTWLNGGV
jgi:hypothetical protein